ncbi:MAG TPA: BTAD domain-containing putative transcriptional regulator [Pseudonocardiaceae bacterium]|nr:BTAD domain-containing putative transcriptional regulator [Pseudonocardiaceae bacterium]
MRVELLGPVRLATEDGHVVPVGGVRLRMLLARLALDPGRFVPVSTLVDGLWGEEPPADAANALQSLVSRLRRAIRDATGDVDVLLSGPAGYQLTADVDVSRFDRLAAEGRAHLGADRPAPAEAVLADALLLWRGTALADVADAPFAGPVATRLAEARLAAAEDRCAALLALGRPSDALHELDRLVAGEPLRERLIALRMRALAGVGRTADALADYQRTRQALADDLGVDPSAELREAHLAVLRGTEQPVRATRVGVPAPLTSFVGRDAELADANALLTAGRLVSLIGAGGAGKTRLAAELAARATGRVWFVELAPVREGAGVGELAPAVLSALDVRDMRILEAQPGLPRDPVDRLVEEFGGRAGLLVLDNCEHLIGGAAELADTLLRRCPALSVLATTREPLAITGESGYRVGPLRLPAETATLTEAAESPAVRLFVDRAAAAQQDFRLTEANLGPVVEICRRLDGMPLALELAAARLRAMTPQRVAELLDDRFRLLTVGSRASLPRHRTLRGVVEWSWDLLTKPERTLAMRLATLAGGADEAAAVGVCADDELAAEDVPYLLASLVEKSLLTVISGAEGRTRYRMLETVRAYGLAELSDTGEADRVDTAFVAYFLGFVERVEPALHARDQLTAFALLGAEHDNVVAAIAKAAAAGDAESAARLVAGMAGYWTLIGAGAEALTLVRVAAEVPSDGPPTAATAGVRLAMLFAEQEDRLPLADFDRMWADAQRVGLTERYPMASMFEVVMGLTHERPERARAAVDRMAASDDPWIRAAARLVACIIAVHVADVEVAERELAAALAGFRALGERWGTAFTLGLLGHAKMIHGDMAGAVLAHEEAVRIAGELGARNLPPMQLMQLGAARGMSGDLDGAERDVRVALSTTDDADLKVVGLCVLIHVHVTRGDLPAARRFAAEADDVVAHQLDDRNSNPRSALAIAKSGIALAVDALDEAAELLARAIWVGTAPMDVVSNAAVGERIAVLTARRGHHERAAVLLGAAAGIRGLLDQSEPSVRALVVDLTERLGPDGYRTAFAQGFDYDRDTAIESLRNAVRPPA